MAPLAEGALHGRRRSPAGRGAARRTGRRASPRARGAPRRGASRRSRLRDDAVEEPARARLDVGEVEGHLLARGHGDADSASSVASQSSSARSGGPSRRGRAARRRARPGARSQGEALRPSGQRRRRRSSAPRRRGRRRGSLRTPSARPWSSTARGPRARGGPSERELAPVGRVRRAARSWWRRWRRLPRARRSAAQPGAEAEAAGPARATSSVTETRRGALTHAPVEASRLSRGGPLAAPPGRSGPGTGPETRRPASPRAVFETNNTNASTAWQLRKGCRSIFPRLPHAAAPGPPRPSKPRPARPSEAGRSGRRFSLRISKLAMPGEDEEVDVRRPPRRLAALSTGRNSPRVGLEVEHAQPEELRQGAERDGLPARPVACSGRGRRRPRGRAPRARS